MARATWDMEHAPDLLKEKSAEAKAWLVDTKKHGIWKAGDQAKAKIVALVNDLYAAGAHSVHAVGIREMGGQDVVTQFVIELPDDKASRARVIQAHNEFWKKYLDDPQEAEDDHFAADHAQKYITVNVDL